MGQDKLFHQERDGGIAKCHSLRSSGRAVKDVRKACLCRNKTHGFNNDSLYIFSSEELVRYLYSVILVDVRASGVYKGS